ncbi:uncharacterized protein LOC102706214 [Oryza brachyantha]|uniref:uncharacterized protein LOC102706214 n=1 Tax=Oryza brachyantha TaxID=4533 RepID=UPI001ADBBAA2|nr:uncharacterized protein LOC102706214 [Oryza brachyantha]
MVPREVEDLWAYYGGRGGDDGGPPHGLLLMGVVLALAIAGQRALSEGAGEAITAAVTDMLSPVGLLLLPVTLVLIIRLLSDDRSAAVLANVFAFGGAPEALQRVGGTAPVGVVVVLFLVLMMVYYRSSKLFGGGDDSSGGE